MAQPSVHGRFIWQELMAADMITAEKFYSKLIGWRVQAPTHTGSPYGVFAAASGSVGGVMPLSEDARQMGARPHWLPYIGAEDVDQTAARAERLGGKVLRPATDVENIGRYAVLSDPQGATFGIYRPTSPAAASAKSRPQRGEFAWQELATSDYEAAFKFYSELFGWEVLNRMDMGPAGTYLIFGRDRVSQGGVYKLSPQMPAPYWLAYIEVENADAVAASAREAGGQVISGPMDVPGGRIAQLLDPGGVLFAVHTVKPAASSPAVEAAPSASPSRSTRPTARRKKPVAAAKPAGKTASKAVKTVAAKPAKKATRKAAKKAAKKALKKAARGARKSSEPGAAGQRARRAVGKRSPRRGSGATRRSGARGGRSRGARRR